MALNDIIRNGVALADSLTQALQPAVTFEPWVGLDGYGGSAYGSPQELPAIVEKTNRLIRDQEGNEIRAENVISVLRPIPENGAAGRKEPIDPRDKFTLPDGSTGPVASTETFIDPGIPTGRINQSTGDFYSGAGYYHIIYLGQNR